MASPAVTFSPDMASLTKPISEEQPQGESLRRAKIYDDIREARREEDPALSQGVWRTDPKRADWKRVEDLCQTALAGKSKDLRIVGWLLEAWLVLHGPRGGTHGMRLLERLCEEYWETLYPSIDGDDLDPRLSPIAWINDNVSLRLKAIALTRPETKEPQIYSWMDWEHAAHLERTGAKPTRDDEATTDRFMTCVLLTPASFYVELERELSALWNVTVDASHLIDELCGRAVAGLWRFKEVLKSIREFVARALDQKGDGNPIPGPVDEISEETASEEAATSFGMRRGPIRSRAEAYQRLEEAADYLIRTEPHSPTPHLVKRAVSWGSMSFSELIRELVQQDHDLRAIYALLGIREDR